MKIKSTLPAVAIAALAGASMLATIDTAHAGGKKRFYVHGHSHHFVWHGYGAKCHWLKKKARWTGKRYWWKRYRHCMARYYW